MSETRNEKYAQTLAKMLKCNTVSYYNQTDKSSYYKFQETLKELFPDLFSVCQMETFNGSILLKWTGKDQNRQVLFMNHQDVVPPTGEWKHDPFGGEISEGKVWGRGALDDKGGLFGMLQAANELAEKKYVPSCNIYFEASCDEESSGLGCREIATVLKERGLKFDWVLDEGGMITDSPISGADGRFAVVGVGEKASVDLKFIAKSAGGHASTPSDKDSLLRLGKFIAECSRTKLFEVNMTPTIRKMFKTLSIKMKGPQKFLMGHPALFKGILEKVMYNMPSARAYICTTLAFTRACGSDANNVLPAEAWVVANMRASHHQGIESSIQSVKKLAAKFDIEVEIIDPGYESGLSSYTTEGFKLIEKAISTVRPDVDAVVPYIMTGASDSRFMTVVSDNCYRFLPFLATKEQIATIHGIDECINVDTLSGGVDFYKYMMENC